MVKSYRFNAVFQNRLAVLFSAFVFCCYVETSYSQTVIACGGFVKGPETIDFSKIEVRLFTTDGILKYQSFCAPHNGYFTVPVYNNGDYVLKLLPPSGWTFTPPQVHLKIDGKTDPCTKQEDINFSFSGFQVSGKVVSAGSDNGPEGLRLELRSEDSKDVKTTSTVLNGGYSFDGVNPGKYRLVAVHLTWRFKENSIPVVVTKGTVVAPTIQVTGYDLTGSVMSDNAPVSGVQLTLYVPEKTNLVIAECGTDMPKVQTFAGFKVICAVQSDTSGVFSFPPLPPGSYRLVPSFNNGRTRFSVVPNTLDVIVTNSTLTVKDPFVVSGFSISGKLVYPSGYPAGDVNVIINDKVVAKTKDDGIYVVEEMKSGVVKSKFSAEHAEFPELSASVSPDNALLPDVMATKLAACGLVVGESGDFSSVEIAARNSKTGSVKKLTVVPKKSQSFCFLLEPGDYNIGVENPEAVFRPRNLAVALKAGPQFGISFEAFFAAASGRVVCLEKDCSGILLTLFQQNDHQELTPIGELKTSKAGDFIFRNLRPGKYLLKATKTPFCFNPAGGLTFTVEDKNVIDLKVIHSGYKLTVTASHPIKLGFRLMTEQKEKPEVYTSVDVIPPQTTVSVCLPQPGKYSVIHEKFQDKADWGCHFFSGSYPTEIDTNNLPQEINPVALLHLVTISVQTTVPVSVEELYVGMRYIENTAIQNKISGKSDDPLADIPPNFHHHFEAEIAEYNRLKATRQPITTPLKRRDRLYFGEDQVIKNPNGTFTHESAIFWYATQMGLEPKHPRLIFKPKTVEFTIDQDAIYCPAFSAFFVGVEAYVLRGYIIPPTAGVRVTLTNRKFPEDMHVIWTEADGTYSLGPLDPGDQFDADASIEGWEIQPIENQPGNFTAKRLGSIDITVADDSSIPLEGVLISISGPGHYRNNSLTPKTGVIHLGSLAGGQYYAQAFRKEYAFQPPNTLVSLNSGEASTIKFAAKRVAYSCFGNVASLNGEPEQGLFVVARSTNCENAPGEEAETDGQGNFRILGLYPHCTYSVVLRSNPQIERTVPSHAIVSVDESDVKDLKIWAVRSTPSQLLITVRLDGPIEFLNTVQVSLLNGSSGVTVHSVNPTAALVAFPPLPSPPTASSYTLKIDPLTNFVNSIYLLQTEAVPIQIDDSGFVHAVLKYDVKRRSDLHEHDSPIAAFVHGRSLMSLFVVISIFAGIGAVYFYLTADKNAKQMALDGTKSFFTNPTDFFKSRLKSAPTSIVREVSPAIRSIPTARQVPAKQVAYSEKTSSDDTAEPAATQFGAPRSSSTSSEEESSSSSSPSPSPAEIAPVEQPRKRAALRSRLQ